VWIFGLKLGQIGFDFFTEMTVFAGVEGYIEHGRFLLEIRMDEKSHHKEHREHREYSLSFLSGLCVLRGSIFL
jgi:hypothetical protein